MSTFVLIAFCEFQLYGDIPTIFTPPSLKVASDFLRMPTPER